MRVSIQADGTVGAAVQCHRSPSSSASGSVGHCGRRCPRRCRPTGAGVTASRCRYRHMPTPPPASREDSCIRWNCGAVVSRLSQMPSLSAVGVVDGDRELYSRCCRRCRSCRPSVVGVMPWHRSRRIERALIEAGAATSINGPWSIATPQASIDAGSVNPMSKASWWQLSAAMSHGIGRVSSSRGCRYNCCRA